jgi:hypothetical protein
VSTTVEFAEIVFKQPGGTTVLFPMHACNLNEESLTANAFATLIAARVAAKNDTALPVTRLDGPQFGIVPSTVANVVAVMFTFPDRPPKSTVPHPALHLWDGTIV